MREASYLLALLGLGVLVVAGLRWLKIARRPDASRSTRANQRRMGAAAKILAIALGLSLLAAVLAITGFFQR